MSNDPARPPFLLVLYQQYLTHQDSACFVREVLCLYTTGTLQRLARHACREVRRAAVLSLGFVSDYGANHTLGCALLDDDRTVRTLAENGIRTVRREQAMKQNARSSAPSSGSMQPDCHRKPSPGDEADRAGAWFAEAWHQRAVAYVTLGRLVESIRDCHQALEINPYHFVAATSMGQAYLQLENPVSALECFRRALRLNPDLEGVRAQVVRLTRMVEDSR